MSKNKDYQLTADEAAAKKLAEFDSQVEAAIRLQNDQKPEGALTNLLHQLDSIRAVGVTAILRLDDVTKKIAIIRFDTVSVPLAALEAAADEAAAVIAEEAALDAAEEAALVAAESEQN